MVKLGATPRKAKGHGNFHGLLVYTIKMVEIAQAGALYKIGDVVIQSCMYVCVPCGYVQYFEVGNFFTTCEACFAGTDLGPVGYQDSASEFWQLVG